MEPVAMLLATKEWDLAAWVAGSIGALACMGVIFFAAAAMFGKDDS